MAIPDVLVTLRFRLVVEILWNCGLRLRICVQCLLHISFLFYLSYISFILSPFAFGYSNWHNFGKSNFRCYGHANTFSLPCPYHRVIILRHASMLNFFFSCLRSISRSGISPRLAIARACLVPHQFISSQRVGPEIVVSSLDRLSDHFNHLRVVRFLKTRNTHRGKHKRRFP